MKLFDKIRQSIGWFLLNKEVVKMHRNRFISNIDDAKTIGILYDASSEEIYNKVSEFVKYFQNKQKNVKALGFVNFNQLPHYCFPKLTCDYFTKRDLNWYYKPTNSRVIDFINEEYDIMIDLCMNDCFPLIYVSAVSKAKFKVGRYGEKYSDIYDFMLNVNNTISLEDYFKETIHYLSIINKNQDEQ
ncbi:MAG: hypothetical protein HGB12_02560 [Bacteroidetes bacterium]|nr:hypothetical protein [Bacteroidota bacterium]